MTQDARLVLVSNRGPATFERDEEGELRAMRGGGGLVTALTGLVNHRDALWIASAMTEEDAEKSREDAVVMLHDYHLYTAPRTIRRANPDVFLHHFVHIPWTQPDAWRVLPRDMREEIFEGILSNDIVGFHTRSYKRNFLLCCRELFDMDVDEEAGVVSFEGRDVWVRAYPLPISAESFERTARRPQVKEYEEELLRRRRHHMILRVDRADLSKNVLRGFTAFDLFLSQ